MRTTQKVLSAYSVTVLVIVIVSVLLLSRTRDINSVYGLANFAGPVTQNLVAGRGFQSVAHVDIGPGQQDVITYHAHRMPLIPFFLAATVEAVGDKLRLVNLIKALVFVFPLLLAVALAFRGGPQADSKRLLSGALLLLVPFLIPTFLIDIVNLQVEEGYSYSLIVLAFAIILFVPRESLPRWTLPFVVCLTGLYLVKSSMILLCVWLLSLFCWQSSSRRASAVAACVLLATVILWVSYVHSATGRFALGTSLDQPNFYKGNNALLINRYPPADRGSLDSYDVDLYQSRHFGNEWLMSDFARSHAKDFIMQHPGDWGTLALRKVGVLWVSPYKIGGTLYTGVMGHIETVGLVVFRLAFWVAVFLALRGLRQPVSAIRFQALSFLGLILSASLPYILGFALTRHASILIFPTFLILYAFWSAGGVSGNPSWPHRERQLRGVSQRAQRS